MKHKNILLVDDQKVDFKILRNLLDDKIKITYQEKYDVAVELIKNKYDLYIIDLYLGGKDPRDLKGLELIKKIRLTKENAKIIAISGIDKTKAIIELCSENGADFFLTKRKYDEWNKSINDFLYPPQILVIDDDSDIIEKFFGFTFDKYQFHYADSLNSGEEIIKNVDIKLIILDLELDKNLKEGFAQGEENIKCLQKYNIPILIFSANKDIDLGIKLLDMNMVSGYLNKNSYEPIEWKKKIKKAIISYNKLSNDQKNSSLEENNLVNSHKNKKEISVQGNNIVSKETHIGDKNTNNNNITYINNHNYDTKKH